MTAKVKECIKQSLADIKNIDKLEDDTPLIGENGKKGLFDNSLCVLEVTSGLVTEFGVDPAIFKQDSFKTVSTLVDTIEEGLKNNEQL